MCGKIKVKAIA